VVNLRLGLLASLHHAWQFANYVVRPSLRKAVNWTAQRNGAGLSGRKRKRDEVSMVGAQRICLTSHGILFLT